MKRRLACLAATLALAAPTARAELYFVIVGGIGGDPVYAEEFADQVASMAAAAERTLGGDERITVLNGESATREALRDTLARLAEITEPVDRLAVFLIGHGTYDGTDYKFNLTGPDIDGAEFSALLAAVPARSQLVVNASSASGAVIEDWVADGRAVITATRSGRERNATRFAEHWATALSAEDADINKDDSLSVQEAYDYAARLTAESYESEGTLATEHSEIRGDGTSAFEISRLRERVVGSTVIEGLYSRVDALAAEMAALTGRREELGNDYLPQFQALAIELALAQQQLDQAIADAESADEETAEEETAEQESDD